jgi:TubC N-terminal docking domain
VTLATLVAELRARGVTLLPDGEALKVRPVSKLIPGELEALRQHKAEVLALLAPERRPQWLRLDPMTLREVLGDRPDPQDVAMLRFDVLDAVSQLKAEIKAGAVAPRLRLVRGHPLCDWLDLAEVAQLLRLFAQRQ